MPIVSPGLHAKPTSLLVLIENWTEELKRLVPAAKQFYAAGNKSSTGIDQSGSAGSASACSPRR